jgi:hypothetical protein
MPKQTWSGLLNDGAPWQTTQGPTLSTASALTTISPQAPTTQDWQMPGQLWYPGAVLDVLARGIYTMGSTATNFNFTLLAGATTLASTGSFAATATQTNQPWELTALVRCIAYGSTGNTLETQGELQLSLVASPFKQFIPMPLTNGPTVAAVDLTVAKLMILQASLSQVTGAPTIKCTQYLLTAVN